jgi:hypothetical protein
MTSSLSSAAPVLRLEAPAEDFLARLTETAYRVALEHGFTGSFLDLQLDLWSALRGVVSQHVGVRPRLQVAAR